MEINEVKTFLEDNKDKEEVKLFLQDLNKLDVARIEEFLRTDEAGKRWLDSTKDKHLEKGINTFKSNNLQKLLDEEILKRFPEKSEKDLELEKLKSVVEQMKTEKLREQLKNKAITTATEKKLPLEIVDFFIAQNEEDTIKNLEMLESVLNKSVEKIVEERLKGGYVPPKDDSSFKGINPWNKDTFNLTKQAEIIKQNPELAKKLKQESIKK